MKRIHDPDVIPGWWVSICCHLDLEELDAELLAEYRAEEDDLGWMCYPSKIEALESIAADWERSGYPEDAQECRAMIETE